MYRITYYISCDDKDTLKPEKLDSYFMTIFNACFDKFTVTEATGNFVNEKGLSTTEKTFIITLIVENNSNEAKEHYISNTCRYLKARLSQESILVTKEVIQANFM